MFEDHQVEAEAEEGSPAGDLSHQLSLTHRHARPLVYSDIQGLGYLGNPRDGEATAPGAFILLRHLEHLDPTALVWEQLRDSRERIGLLEPVKYVVQTLHPPVEGLCVLSDLVDLALGGPEDRLQSELNYFHSKYFT